MLRQSNSPVPSKDTAVAPQLGVMSRVMELARILKYALDNHPAEIFNGKNFKVPQGVYSVSPSDMGKQFGECQPLQSFQREIQGILNDEDGAGELFLLEDPSVIGRSHPEIVLALRGCNVASDLFQHAHLYANQYADSQPATDMKKMAEKLLRERLEEIINLNVAG